MDHFGTLNIHRKIASWLHIAVGRRTHRSVDLHAVDLRRAARARFRWQFHSWSRGNVRPACGGCAAGLCNAGGGRRRCAAAATQVGTVWSLWSSGNAVGNLSDWHRVDDLHAVGADVQRRTTHATQLLGALGPVDPPPDSVLLTWWSGRWCLRAARPAFTDTNRIGWRQCITSACKDVATQSCSLCTRAHLP